MYTGGGLWFNARRFPDDPRPGAASAAAAGGPPPRAAAVRLPVPGDLRLPGRARSRATRSSSAASTRRCCRSPTCRCSWCVAVVVALYVRAGRRLSLDRLISGSLLVFGAMGLGFAVLAARLAPAWLYPVVYVWVGRARRAGAGAGVDARQLRAHARARRAGCSASWAPARRSGPPSAASSRARSRAASAPRACWW